MNKWFYFMLVLVLPTVMSCEEKSKDGKELSTTTSGSVSIVADETLLPIVDSEKQVFETLYPKAKLEIKYLPEAEAIAYFLNDSAQLIFLPRALSESEKQIFSSQKRSYRENKIATDAIALICNKSQRDTTLEMAQFREILRGNFTQWNQLNEANSSADIQLVFDHQNSSTVKYLAQLVGKEKVNGFAVKKNKEVIEYVMQNKNAIGIIGVNWISDMDDSATTLFKENIKVIGLKADPGDLGDDYFYQPYQAYLGTKQYPLIREVFTISREPRAGLATGFASFVSGDKGQRIILKSGLLPASAPVRIIQTN